MITVALLAIGAWKGRRWPTHNELIQGFAWASTLLGAVLLFSMVWGGERPTFDRLIATAGILVVVSAGIQGMYSVYTGLAQPSELPPPMEPPEAPSADEDTTA